MLTIHTFHPLVVQFATVLLFVTPIGLVVWSHVQTPSWHAAAFSTSIGGALGATLAYPTGVALTPYGINSDLMDTYLSTHQLMAFATLILSWVVVAMIARAYFVSRYTLDVENHERVPYWTRFTTIVAAIACGVCAAYTSHLGVTMVWGNAV